MRKIAIIFAVFCSLQMSASAFTVPGNPTGFVNDYANILSGDTKQKLEEELRSFNASTSNEIAVVTISSLDGDTVENYAVKLFESWKIGKAKEDNGVLLLIAKDDHKLRIEVGYGLEGALPDILAKDIIDNKITPSFKNGDYDTGVTNGVKAIIEATQGEYKATTKQSSNSMNSDSIFGIFMFVIFGFQFLFSILARSKSWWAGGVLGGVVGLGITLFHVFGITLVIGSVVTFILVCLGLVFDYVVSKTYVASLSRGGGIPWWIGGGRGGSSFGGGTSFGGFGGGSSGGGGASGSW